MNSLDKFFYCSYMRTMQFDSYISAPAAPESAYERMMAAIREAAERAKDKQRAELRRMAEAGMGFVEQLKLSSKGLLSPIEEAKLAKRSKGIIQDFCNVARAVRQVLILEQELEGIRPSWRKTKRATLPKLHLPPLPSPFGTLPDYDMGPLPDDLLDDYDTKPVGDAVAFIRETLGLDAPAEDPFPPPSRPRPVKTAQPPEPQTAEAAASEIPAKKPAPRKPAPALPVYDLPIDRDPASGLAIVARRPPAKPHPPPRGPP